MSTRTLNLDVRSEPDVHGFTKEHPITNSNPSSITEVEGSYGTYGATKQGDLGVAKHSTLKDAFPKTSEVFADVESISLLVQEGLNASDPQSFNPDFENIDFNMTRSVPTDAELESLVDKPGRNYPNVMYPSVEGAINNNVNTNSVTPIIQTRNVYNYGNEPVTYTASTLYSEIVISSDRGTDGEVMQETIGRYLSSGQ